MRSIDHLGGMLGSCKVCGLVALKESREGHSFLVECERCGTYRISDTCVAIIGPSDKRGLLNSEQKRASVGYWLRDHQRDGFVPTLKSDTVEMLAKAPWLPSLHDQKENLLRLIASRAEGPGVTIVIEDFADQYAIGAGKQATVGELLKQLAREGLADQGRSKTTVSTNEDAEVFDASLTFAGWLAHEDILRGKTSGKNAFIAMPFNKPDLEEAWLPRLRLAVRETGFELKRVDDEPEPGLIDVKMRVQIRQARFLIVELTHANNGAYWEAGFAEGLGKPVIYCCHEDEKAHFDVDHSWRVVWSPVTIDTAIDRLKATIRNALPDATPEV
ncbi:MAG: hypothetical protein JSR89_17185 [Proteobacteria bacterium]|nr:hypothetical protein [Pseudomonadota bacterium]